jgi:hypothetical protein
MSEIRIRLQPDSAGSYLSGHGFSRAEPKQKD